MNKGLRHCLSGFLRDGLFRVRRSDLMNKGLRLPGLPFLDRCNTVRRSDLMNKGFVEGFGNTEYRRQESE